MSRVATKQNRMSYPMGAPGVSVSRRDISQLATEQRAVSEAAEMVSIFATDIGRKAMKADYKAQLTSGQAEVDTRIYELYNSLRTNPDETTYDKVLKDTLEKIRTEVLPTITNEQAKMELQENITASQPRWKNRIDDYAFQTKKTNVAAKVEQLRDTAINKRDLRDPNQLCESQILLGEATNLLEEIGVPKEQRELWTEEAFKEIEAKEIQLQAETIAEAKGYEQAVKWVMGQKRLDIDEKRSIVSDIKFEAAQKQLEYDNYVESIEQQFLTKLRDNQLTEDEIMASGLEVDKKQEWLRYVDAQVKERLEGEVSLNWEAYDKLQAMVEDYDAGKIEKDKVREAISKEVGKTITTTIARSLRDRLATKDDPDDPMNRSDAKRGLGVINDLESFEIEQAKKDDADLEEIREIRLAYQKKKDEFEGWIKGQEKLTDTDIQNKIDEMTQLEAEEQAKGFLGKFWETYKRYWPAHRLYKYLTKEEKEGEKEKLTPEIARQYLNMAGGDRKRAEELAKDAGYEW